MGGDVGGLVGGDVGAFVGGQVKSVAMLGDWSAARCHITGCS